MFYFKFICLKSFLYYLCPPVKKGITDFVAQLVEQYTFNVWVLGSSPSEITINWLKPLIVLSFKGFLFIKGKQRGKQFN